MLGEFSSLDSSIYLIKHMHEPLVEFLKKLLGFLSLNYFLLLI